MLLECLVLTSEFFYPYEVKENSRWLDLTQDIIEFILILTVAGVTVWAATLIRKWKKNELSHHGYRWNFKDEGLFLLFWIA